MNPLKISRSLTFLAVSTIPLAWGQTAHPSFEVASVKLADPQLTGGRGGQPDKVGAKISANGIDIANLTLSDVIVGAYRIKGFQLEGPDWMKSVRVNIMARLPVGALENQIPEMLQTLFAERFGLTLHRETRQVPVYALTVNKTGVKLTEAPPDPEHPYVAPAADAPDFGLLSQLGQSTMSGDPGRGMVMTDAHGAATKVTMGPTGIKLEISRMDMPTLASQLSNYMDRPVVDKTGLKGQYVVTMDASMADMMNFIGKMGVFGGGGMPPPGAGAGGGGFGGCAGGPALGSVDDLGNSGSAIVTSLKNQGLKLSPEKAPFPILVIDHLNRTPTEN